MAAFQPFEPNVQQAKAGFTVNLQPIVSSSLSTSLNAATCGFAPCILVTNIGGTTPTYVRLSSEAVATATTADTPVLPNTVRLFANPNPNGIAAIGVICTVSGQSVYFTPGQGGDY